MRSAPRCVLPALLFVLVCAVRAQSAVDAATLHDLKLAAKQMELESEGVPSFRLEANYQVFDYLGRPENEGRWTEEFGRAGYAARTVHDGGSPENYAPEDQANIGAPAPAVGGTFMQRFLVDAMLHPAPTEAQLDASKLSYKSQKVGALNLRCVVLEPKEKAKNAYLARVASRAYCLAQDAPVIRLAQLSFGLVVSYNNLANYGGRTFAKQVSASQRGHDRGKLTITKFAAAPELMQANLPNVGAPATNETGNHPTGAARIDAKLAGGNILSKAQPVYPMDAKTKHISGSVFLHAVISKQGTIESLEVIAAPSDDLAESALDAVSQWRYKPYLLNGVPTEVDTTITVNYSFG